MGNLCFGLDLSSPKGSYCVFEDSQPLPLILEKELPGSFTHSESLLTELGGSLSQLGISLSDITLWITASGPGSFTGLRIAHATLKAFALATKRPILTVEAPEARAAAFLQESTPLQTLSTLDVFSYLTAERSVVSSFEVQGATVRKMGEKIQPGLLSDAVSGAEAILTEERTDISNLSNPAVRKVLFPLRARHLRFFENLSSKKEHGLNDIHALTPVYFGSSHFE